MKSTISNNIRDLRGQIAAACERYDRDTDEITVVAVSKNHSAAALKTAVAAGIHNIGESRIQEAEPKINEVGRIARFHLVGHLQSNKVRKAVQLFDVIQSVDSLNLAEEISRQASLLGHAIECLIEVNCSGEEQKYGVSPEGCPELIRQVRQLPALTLSGLMTIGPNTDDEDRVRSAFRQCRDLFKSGQDIAGSQFDVLSMGMSADFVWAIAEGATMIRVGTQIFGPRES
jgi:pyridoxal phosphate enzyme (YggS family)